MKIPESSSVHPIRFGDIKPWLLKKHYAHRIPPIIYAFGLYDMYGCLKAVCSFGRPVEALGLVPHERRQVSKCHPVLQYDNHGNFIREWRSKQAVEESLHIISQTLNKYIKSGKVDTHGWMWKEKYPEE